LTPPGTRVAGRIGRADGGRFPHGPEFRNRVRERRPVAVPPRAAGRTLSLGLDALPTPFPTPAWSPVLRHPPPPGGWRLFLTSVPPRPEPLRAARFPALPPQSLGPRRHSEHHPNPNRARPSSVTPAPHPTSASPPSAT